MNFYYIYKPLSHPEFNNYVSAFTLEERLMHVKEAERRLGTGITWLADSMDNRYHDSMGQTPNSELVIGPNGRIAARRPWSDPQALRADLERMVGPVENPTTVDDLDLPIQPPPPTVARGIVPRIERPKGMMPLELEPVLDTRAPFYVKLRAEGDQALFTTGQGILYLGLHLNPLYRVHWNNEAGPVQYRVTAPTGVTVAPASGAGPEPEEGADADPREFLVEVDGAIDTELNVDVFYFACDDDLTFCIPVNQSYLVTLARDSGQGWSLPMDADGAMMEGFNAMKANEALQGQAKSN